MYISMFSVCHNDPDVCCVLKIGIFYPKSGLKGFGNSNMHSCLEKLARARQQLPAAFFGVYMTSHPQSY